jgi:succinate dehydrogenase / fumarate reductase iron-sulfur subunit
MNQIMRLRRRAGSDHGIVDRNNGQRHESAFNTLVRQNGLLWEAELLPRSYGGDNFFGKFAPPAALELVDSLPVITKALLRRKVTPMGALKPHKLPKDALKSVQKIFETIEDQEQRRELNLYITGTDEDNE